VGFAGDPVAMTVDYGGRAKHPDQLPVVAVNVSNGYDSLDSGPKILGAERDYDRESKGPAPDGEQRVAILTPGHSKRARRLNDVKTARLFITLSYLRHLLNATAFFASSCSNR
jgi:hypothetical protein